MGINNQLRVRLKSSKQIKQFVQDGRRHRKVDGGDCVPIAEFAPSSPRSIYSPTDCSLCSGAPCCGLQASSSIISDGIILALTSHAELTAFLRYPRRIVRRFLLALTDEFAAPIAELVGCHSHRNPDRCRRDKSCDDNIS